MIQTSKHLKKTRKSQKKIRAKPLGEDSSSLWHKIKIVYNFNSIDRRKTGLMYIMNPLPVNTGALFTFDTYNYKSFWMKNTFIPLDILLLDENYKIVCIHTNTIPLSEQKLFCDYKILYAVETNADFVKNNNVQIGDYLRIHND